jgi:Holliday junction resolvase
MIHSDMQVPKRIKGKGGGLSSHARAPRQERELAKRVGGNTVRGSGSGKEKGDVRLHRVCRIEAKTTSKQSFSVTREMIEKIETAAMCHGEMPVLIVEFNDNGVKACEVAITPTWVLDLITNQTDNK